MDKKIILLVLILICTVALTGCWGKSEFSEILFASSMGIDAIDDGYLVTVLVRLPKDTKGEGGSVWTVSGKGETIYDAIHNLYNRSPRKIFWGHLNTVILGEDAVMGDFAQALDVFTRAQELRRKSLVLTTQGKAQEFLIEGAKLAAAIDPFYLVNLIRNYEKTTASHMTTINDVLVSIGEQGHDLWIPSVKVIDKLKIEDLVKKQEATQPEQKKDNQDKEKQGKSEEEAVGEEQDKKQKSDGQEKQEGKTEEKTEESKVIEITGGALFREDKFVTWIDEEETRKLCWLIGNIKSGVLIIDNPAKEGAKLTFDVLGSKSKIKLLDEQPLKFQVQVKASLSVIEATIEPPNHQVKKGLELEKEIMASVEKEIQKQIEEVIEITQKNNCDVIGLGEWLNSWHPDLFIQQKWHDVFSAIPIEVEVKPILKLKSLTQS